MRVIVLGADGYLGWPTCMYLAARGHDVLAIDSEAKRGWEYKVGVFPLCISLNLTDRCLVWSELGKGRFIAHLYINIAESGRVLYEQIEKFQPDAIIHYAEQPSAPFSMISRSHAIETQQNNINGTLNLLFAVASQAPDCHIIKLGTMGEYGTPNIDIEEGWLNVSHNGREDRVLFPKKPGSFYHLSKVHDSHNLEFACRTWGLRVTDLNQGIVYGIDTDETVLDPDLRTSFHYVAIFGTVLNRFITQAVIGEPLTVYGEGGQTRGFLNIRDTLRCVELAMLNPAERGEFRVFNQFTEQFSVIDLALMVGEILKGQVTNIPNPRKEDEQHYYNAVHTALPDLGLEPHLLTVETIQLIAERVLQHKDNVDRTTLLPSVKWRQG